MKKLLLLVMVIAIAKITFAQVVNIEYKRIKTDTIGWAGSGGALLFINKNNDFVLSFITDIHLQYKHKKSLYLLLTDITTVQVNEDQSCINSGFQHFRYNYKIRDKFV